VAADGELIVTVLAERLSIVRLEPGNGLPSWIRRSSWLSLTRTHDELSVVCESRLVPVGLPRSSPWRALQVVGPLNFELTGILKRLADPLAAAAVSIFAVSTYDTDYVLVQEGNLESALMCLKREGIVVRTRR
jgi:hypothetical protein